MILMEKGPNPYQIRVNLTMLSDTRDRGLDEGIFKHKRYRTRFYV